MPSIVNPAIERNGASTVTQGLFKALAQPPLQARIDCIPVREKPMRWQRLGQARSLFRAGVSQLPAKAAFCYSRALRNEITTRLAREHYDLVMLNGSDILWLLDYLPPSIPRILVAHNIEYQLFDSQIRSLGWMPPPLPWLLRRDYRRLREFEVKGLGDSLNVIFLSHADAAHAGVICPGLNAVCVPPLFDHKPWNRPGTNTTGVLEISFLGNFGWWPNQAALRWFVDQVLPHVRTPVRLHLYGQGSERSCPDNARIVKHGMVESIEQVWKNCDLSICPTLSEAGVHVKLAEAVYNRIPILAATQAVRGIALQEDPAIVLLDGCRSWIDFLNSTAVRDLASRRVSEKVASVFSVDTHKDALQSFVATRLLAGAAA